MIVIESRVSRATLRQLLYSACGLSEGQAQRLAHLVGWPTSFRGGGDDDRRANIKREAIIYSPTFKEFVDLALQGLSIYLERVLISIPGRLGGMGRRSLPVRLLGQAVTLQACVAPMAQFENVGKARTSPARRTN